MAFLMTKGLDLMPTSFKKSLVKVVARQSEGESEVTSELLRYPFYFINLC